MYVLNSLFIDFNNSSYLSPLKHTRLHMCKWLVDGYLLYLFTVMQCEVCKEKFSTTCGGQRLTFKTSAAYRIVSWFTDCSTHFHNCLTQYPKHTDQNYQN